MKNSIAISIMTGFAIVLGIQAGPANSNATKSLQLENAPIQTQRLEIVDKNGNPRIVLAVGEDGNASVDLYDTQERLRGRLAS